MKKRIKNILNYKKPGRIAVLAAAAVCAAVTICFATEAKSSSIPQTAGSNVSRTSQEDLPARTACVKQWAEAFCSRDAGTVFRMLDDKGRKQFGDAGLLEGEHSFGWSSPWPWETDTINDRKNYKVLSVGKDSAKILYYAWTSDPHVTVWAQVLMYQYSKDTGNIRIQNASLEVLDNIHNAKQFYTAYPDGQIDGTQMDYYKGNGVGEALDRNIRQSDDAAILRQPQTAAMYLLNIQNNPSVVRAETDTAGSSTIVTFTFLEDGSTASVKMIRPFGEQGIWVPQTDTAAAYGTLMAKSQTVSKKDFWLYGVSTMAGGKMRLIYKNGKTLLIKGRYKKASTMEGLSDEADKQYSYSLKAAKNCIVEMVEADNVQTMDYADWAAGQSLKKGDRISFISAAFWIKNKKIIKISFSA